MDSWPYLLVLGACVAVTLPLELVGGARVYRRPKALLTYEVLGRGADGLRSRARKRTRL